MTIMDKTTLKSMLSYIEERDCLITAKELLKKDIVNWKNEKNPLITVSYADGQLVLDLEKMRVSGINTDCFYTQDEFDDKANGA